MRIFTCETGSSVARALAAIAMAGSASLASAQTVDETVGNAAEDGSGGDIVVTAQKREQRLQDVPIAVQVLDSSLLEANAVREFTDLDRASPSLSVRASEHPVNGTIAVRGIGTTSFAVGIESSVAVQLDDVPVAFQARAFTDLQDVERIEILRGPQSTLYGKSASAGLVNIVTKAPTSTLTGRISALGTTDDEYGLSGALSGPLGDTLGFRVTAGWSKFSGNVDNAATGKKINGRENVALRGKLVWDPTDTVNVAADVSYIDGSTTFGRPFTVLSPNTRLRGIATLPPSVFAPGIDVGFGNDTVSNDFESGTKYDDFAQSLRVSVDLGPATLMSITSHDKFYLNDFLDHDGSAVASVPNFQIGTFDSEQFTQEIRVVSSGADRFRYTFGLYYADTGVDRTFDRGPRFAVSQWAAETGSEQFAAFGQLEFDILPTTTLIGGIRSGTETVDYTYVDLITNARFAGSDKDNYVTYKAGVQHRFTPEIMAFLTHATGYKGQAFDLSSGFNTVRAAVGAVEPETASDWQLGLKSQLFDRAVTFNVTLFNTEFENFQAQGIENLPNGTVNFRLANVGKLRTRGVEVEASARLGDDLSVGGGVTYLDARIIEYPFAQCYAGQTAAQGCTGTPAAQDLAGFRPGNAPEWKIAANAEWSPQITDALEGLAQLTYSYQSDTVNLSQDPALDIDEYSIFNLSLGVRGPDRKWQVVAFVNNLFDKRYYYNFANLRGNFGNQDAVLGYLPRDFYRYGGIRASFNF